MPNSVKAAKPAKSNASDIKPVLYTKAFINGAWKSGKTFAVKNPSTGETIANVTNATSADAKAAIAAAKAAFPAWKALLPKARADIMKKFHALILQNAGALAALLSTEQGKPLAEAKGEILYGAAFIEWFAEEARRIYGRTVPAFKDGARTIITREPVGVCAAITPWNFPNAMITRKLGPALAAGCTFVLKPAEDTPLSALALAELSRQAGIPKGVFNVVPTTQAKDIGQILSSHPDVAKLSFTGSTEVGRLLMAQSAPTLKRLSMELGGNAPFIVFDDADIKMAVTGALQSKFRNSGQTCVCANRLYVQQGIYSDFLKALTEAAKGLKLADAFVADAKIGPLINEDGLKKVQDLVADAKKQGGKVVLGGVYTPDQGLFYPVTVISGAKPAMKLAKTEIFGPVAAIFPFKTEKEALKLANSVEHGLASYVYTRDLGRAFRLSEGLEYGMVAINEGILSSETAPFGGVKQSGFGREGGAEGIEEYTQVKYTLFGGLAG